MRIHHVILLVATTACLAPAGDQYVQTDEYGCRVVACTAEDIDPPNAIPAGMRSDPAWIPLGPFGGDVKAIAASPIDANIVLAGLAPEPGTGRLFRSTDAGATWSEISALTGTDVWDIEFAPDGTAYLGTENAFWKSTDAGVTWTNYNLGIEGYQKILDVAIDPTNANNIWVGVHCPLTPQDKVVLVSTDGGTIWTDVTPPLSMSVGCAGIAFDPNDTNKVYACFRGWMSEGDFWVSSDYGATWTQRSAGLPNRPLNAVVHDGTRLLLGGGMLFGSQFVGLYESTDDGVTWTALHDGSWPLLVIRDIDLDPADVDTILLASEGAGVYRSTDAGATWEFGIGNTDGLPLNCIRFAPGSSSVIYAGACSLAVYKSVDGGAGFLPSSVGMGALDVYNVDANPNDINELAISFQALNSGGLYTSVNGGVTWTLEPAPGTRWNDVRFAPDGTLYALNAGPSTIAPDGLYRRNIDGSWTCLGPDQGPYFETELFAIRFSQNNPNLIVMGGGDYGAPGHEATIWRSTDLGANWTKVYDGPQDHEEVKDIAFVEDGTDTVMVACFNDRLSGYRTGGALRSTDGGLTWSESSTGLDALAQGLALDVSPTEPNTFYYADEGRYSDGGLFKSTDAGQTWTEMGNVGGVYDVVSHPADDQVLYLMQGSPKVSRSDDGGATFSAFDAGLVGTAGTPSDLTYAVGFPARLLLASSTGTCATDLVVYPGDIDGDGDVDIDDFNIFAGCLSGPDVPVESACEPADLDGDEDVDLPDFALFQAAFAGTP
ncbi:MAG: hypothetical protein ABIG44_00650 [Planctomycetota bacterium]